MNPSQTFDPDLYDADSPAAQGGCTHHGGAAECSGEAVVSFQDADGGWQSGCSLALEELVERDVIEPLGQGA